ncbi:MAG TPA: hypothetical protein VK897_00510 [Anaerolineales bacterium]|nr:hypothetical protein [Anaerolineales bacterium]
MKQYISHVKFLIVALLFIALTFLPLFASADTLDAFAREDGIFENLTAFYLFLTSVVFAIAFFRFRKSSWLLRLSFAGLALLFFMGAGEEISWGERIFDWDDKNYIRGINVQGELTLHNLKYFQGEDSILPVSISQLFILFVFGFAVLIPVVCLLFPKIERLVAPHFPVLPWVPGLLVVVTYVFQKLMLRILPMFPALYQHPTMPIPQGVHEIREHGYTFAVLASAVLYVLAKSRNTQPEVSREVQVNMNSPAAGIPLSAKSAGDKS